MHSDNVSKADVSEDGNGGGGHVRERSEGVGDGTYVGNNTAKVYLHKKLKKMVTMREDEFGNLESSSQIKEKSTNVSLEALFEVTGHELEKIKNSTEVGSARALMKRIDPGDADMLRGSAFEVGDEMTDSNCGSQDSRKARSSSGRHSCPFCGLACGKPSVLQKHIRAHTNERPYPCIPCGFAFKTKSNLYKHCKSRAHHLRATRELGGEGDTTALAVQWPANGSETFVRPPETDESSESNDDLMQSIDKRTDTEHFPASLPVTDHSIDISKLKKTSAVGTPIYKPKFHLVTHDSSINSNKNLQQPQQTDFDCSRATASRIETDPSPVDSNRTVPVESDTRSNLPESLAGRHKRQFHLRLEIPPSISPEVPRSNHSSTSISSGFSSQSECRSSSNCATQDTKCPKLASPEYLQEHISKLISQNAAIVDTLDPRWPRRYTRQASIASSQNVDGELRSKERLRRLSEDVTLPTVAPHLAKSKLARALLATTVSNVICSPLSNTVSVLEKTMVGSCLAEELTNSAQNKIHSTISENAAVSSASHKEKQLTIQPKDGSFVKSLLTSNTKTDGEAAKGEENTTSAAVDVSGHPQNPEGSIIKDLLLKARTNDVITSVPPACVRLSGGSISIVPTAVSVESSLDDSSIALYNCSICNISFRSPENLEVHQLHYCRQTEDKRAMQLTDHNLYGCDVTLDQTRTSLFRDGNGNDVLPTTCTSIHKPRGRPKGSKNRPKVDNMMITGGRHCRAQSRSITELPEDVGNTARCNLTYTKGINLPESSNSIREILTSLSPCLTSAQTESMDGDNSTDTSSVTDSSPSYRSHAELVDMVTDGPILKKHLMSGFLSGDRSPPLKKRKVPVNVTQCESATCRSDTVSSNNRVSYTSFLKSLEHLSKNPMRATSSGHLFGGEVHVCDSITEPKRLLVDTDALCQMRHSDEDEESSECAVSNEITTGMPSSAAVVTTIAKPVHNSGGTVLQVHSTSFPVSTCIHVATVGRPLMATGSHSGRGITSNLSGAIVLSPSTVNVSSSMAINISHLNLMTSAMVGTSNTSLTFPSTAECIPTTTQSNKPVTITPTPFSSTGINQASTPNDRDSCLNIFSDGVRRKMERISRSDVPTIAIISPKSPSDKETDVMSLDSDHMKHLTPTRPTSLPLRGIHLPMVGTTLVSPETPRPKKKYGQCYLNGQYYTYLELKQSTKVYYCCIHRPQPMYVPQATDPKLSMYSVWQTVNAKDDPSGITPVQALGLYDSRHRDNSYTQAAPTEMPLQTTHSSYWTFRQKSNCEEAEERVLDCNTSSLTVEEDGEHTSNPQSEEGPVETKCNEESEAMLVDNDFLSTSDSCTTQMRRNEDHHEHVKNVTHAKSREPKRVKIFEGGFKSNEDYTYVRGRGRGKYVCEECGIRCKKPSMLKKHIRTHTDVRPYTCKHCNFSFKTKGNLTKHMKSKAHHKKCVEMGVVPVPVAIDDVQIDEEALARQERIEHQRRQFANDEDSSLEDDEEDDDDEYDDEYDAGNEGYREGEDEDDESVEMEGQFDDAFGTDFKTVTCENASQKIASDQVVVARSLLDLSKPSFFGRNVDHGVPQSGIENSKDVAGNHHVSWSTENEPIENQSTYCRVPLQTFSSVAKEENLNQMSNSTESGFMSYTFSSQKRLHADRVYMSAGWSEQLSPQKDNLSLNATCPPSSIDVDVTIADQPIDLSMPHTRTCDSKSVRNQDSLRPLTVKEASHVDLRCYENVSPVMLPKEDDDSYVLNQQGSRSAQESEMVPAVSPLSPDDDAAQQQSLVHQTNRQATNVTCVDNNGNLSLYSTIYTSKETVQTSGHCSSPSHRHMPFVGLPASPSTSVDTSTVKTLSDCPRPLTPIGFQKMPTYMQRPNEDGKCICSICNKTFSRPSQLRLHVNIHYFERPFRCDSCAISFRTKGHLQKHKRSVSHYNKVNMNLTFGTPTTDNPRPFKCADCKIAFRIHGHLAKHLRSKMHIMKLECLGKLPFGTYAEIERSGANLNEIDTTDCENSLESLQTMALKLVDKVPTRHHWSRERTISGGSCDDQSDGVPYVESPGCGPESGQLMIGLSGGEGGAVSPEFTAADRLVVWSQSVLESNVAASPEFVNSTPSSMKYETSKFEGDDDRQPLHVVSRTSAKLLVVVECERRASDIRRIIGGPYPPGSLVQSYEDISEDDDLDGGSIASCGILQSPSRVEITPNSGKNENTVSLASTVTTSASELAGNSWRSSNEPDKCELCRETFSTSQALTQHMLVHAQLRPYVCDYCDAGFTTIQHLQAHVQIHQKQVKAFQCSHCQQTFEHNDELESHLESIHANNNHDEDQVR